MFVLRGGAPLPAGAPFPLPCMASCADCIPLKNCSISGNVTDASPFASILKSMVLEKDGSSKEDDCEKKMDVDEVENKMDETRRKYRRE